MSIDWTHQFCLACDKQTDGATYCSESCRLADYEKTSPPSYGASSPTLVASHEWSLPTSTTANTKAYPPPAYEFGNQQYFSPRISPPAFMNQRSESNLSPTTQALSPSNSHTSLCSMRSNSSVSTQSSQLAEKAARELRAYALSFESVRLQRRRSY